MTRSIDVQPALRSRSEKLAARKKADISTIRAQAPTYDKEKDGSSYEIRIPLLLEQRV